VNNRVSLRSFLEAQYTDEGGGPASHHLVIDVVIDVVSDMVSSYNISSANQQKD